MDKHDEKAYWTQRYQEARTGWDIGYPSAPLKAYIDQLEDKNMSILLPGAGNAYEAEYLWKQGFNNIRVMDISELPLTRFSERIPDFPESQLLVTDFFEHQGQYDLILEQTFFCSIVPSDDNRFRYAQHMAKLLKPEGKLVGVWFDFPLGASMEKRPFGGDKKLYLKYLNPFFDTITFEKCYNSIRPRQGIELFGIFKKK
ncbi:methyltransferase domain-containing protein [Flavobacteriaceae bacterium TP-CH-4]|uniref:Methyltransferase domain-containing protein n=1 Tax=Pelagihabitans pacificus TaxID=2696054 RepID=A0A967ASA5_9FLAO|nr:methyltransferase domain-containing protein [Pelagihabitans pacificus]NHF59444.1 methyltransferase domain-containing protein [Pelagihabitans pacificus]